jgi:hypothetical protein
MDMMRDEIWNLVERTLKGQSPSQEQPPSEEEPRSVSRRVLIILGVFVGFAAAPGLVFLLGLLTLRVSTISMPLAVALLLGIVCAVVFLIRRLIRWYETRRR